MNNREKHTPVIRLFHVEKRYGTRKALDDISLDIFKGDFLFITGASGAGKSTLLKLLYRNERVSAGQILVEGMNLARISHRQVALLRRQFGIIFQDFKLINTKTVYENVALVLESMGEKPAYVRRKVRSMLRGVGLEGRLEAFPPSLSGGEQQRVAVARAVATRPKVILADEPTGSLDPAAAEVIFKMLRVVHANGATVIVATHDLSFIRRFGGRVIILEQGRLVSSATCSAQDPSGASHQRQPAPGR